MSPPSEHAPSFEHALYKELQNKWPMESLWETRTLLRPAAALVAMLLLPGAVAQTAVPCTSLSGTVEDSTGALLPGATVTLDGAAPVTANSAGHFSLTCVTAGSHTLRVNMAGFGESSLTTSVPHRGDIHIKLSPSTEVSISVQADEAEGLSTGGMQGMTVTGTQLEALADDPDDLLRELQQMGAAAGGSPGSTTISVDGFQGDSALPPKDSIAFINVAPDMFSAEYREAPFGGGRVEVYTKPGASAFHGSIFSTNSSHWMNAQDPFSRSNNSIGKQRYGFDLSGPIRGQHSNFRLTLEHRSIDEVSVVNAIVPGGTGVPMQTTYTVPAPQRLWEATARVDLQLGPKNIFSAGYQSNINNTVNNGVGGNTLVEAGYQSGNYDHVVRLSNITTVSPNLLHEARYSLERRGETDVPNGLGPSQQVSGYFTGGGATFGNLRNRTWINEFDDDFILNTKKHLIKAGVQGIYDFINDALTTNFNGTYIYGGYTNAAGVTVSPLAQYQATIGGNGTATEFNNVAGTPRLQFFQARQAFFFEDTYKANNRWTFSYGTRYAFETSPGVYNALVPRGGIKYVPGEKSTWELSAHFGLFSGNISRGEATEQLREDGVQRVTSLVYHPVYGSPLVGATPIQAYRTQVPRLTLPTDVYGEFSVSKELPKGFSLTVQEVLLRTLTQFRTLNINSPLTQNPYGARPIAPNINILQLRDDGTGQGHGEFIGLSNFKQKRVQFFFGALHINIRANSDGSTTYQPQSAYTSAGEEVRQANGNSLWQMFGNLTAQLPYKMQLSGNGFANGGQPFDILTGTDNNGDGTFNDRPQYAAPGAAANGTSIFQTPFGSLNNAGTYVNGVPQRPIARNLGALPWNFHLDANLQRKWVLTHRVKAAHEQSLTANLRSANFLNHTNVTSEGSVLGSPQFLIPVAADKARRVEFGLRYSF